MDFSYKASVIVPIYNAEKYLEECLTSLVDQTINKSEIEILLINDGSSDNSEKICNQFCSRYDYFKYISIENSGVSVARNIGIKNAKGKYIIFLDSDDKLTNISIEQLTNFFDKVYDKVDLVTYFIQPYRDDVLLEPHSRFRKLLTHTDVYDLEKNPYIVQTTMNICVKNFGEDNELFNEEMSFQEDQEYISRILEKKLKIGYCAKATYLYNRSNDNSCVNSKFHAYYIFENAMQYFENLFSRFEDKVPKYFQALYFHDLRWKLTSKILFPFHYEKEEYDKAIGRIKNLLRRVDVDIITSNPSINKKHIRFWLNLKPNAFPQPFVGENMVDVVANGVTIEHSEQFVIRLLKTFVIEGGKLRIRALIENGIYDFVDEKPEVYVIYNEDTTKKLDVYLSSFSYVSTNIETNKAFGFCLDIDPKEVKRLRFKAVFDSYNFDVRLIFTGSAVFKHKTKKYSYARGEYVITYDNDALVFEKKSKEEIMAFEKNQAKLYHPQEEVYSLKCKAIDYRNAHKVWLYSDLGTVLKDNAYYQFINDFKHDDGIERYYVYTRPLNEIENMFTQEQRKFLIEFGSAEHKLLYLSAQIIFSSFFGYEAISPFENNIEEFDYIDIEHFDYIYMQHGILHASYVQKYSAEKAICNYVVVSSKFEIENLTEKYNYKNDQLICSGMPRYSLIDKSVEGKNKILLAPSWRSYFASNQTANSYSINLSVFHNSDYYKGLISLLRNPKLKEALEKNNIELDVKMHPIINDVVSDLFDIKCDNIKMISDDVKLEDYNAFVTDFSSFVFDFAYLNRPIVYFVPDYLQFKSGMNLYRDLDLPFEEAFGPFTKDANEAANYLIDLIENKFVSEKKYSERMNEFYLPMENCEEDIYNFVKKRLN